MAGSPRWLAVLDSLRWLEAQGDFELLAVCVMANHLHLIVELPSAPAPDFEATLRDFKRHTARTANALLGRSGRFWQPESFDRMVRDDGDGRGLTQVIRYVVNNPVKVGLCQCWEEWPGTWCKWAVT